MCSVLCSNVLCAIHAVVYAEKVINNTENKETFLCSSIIIPFAVNLNKKKIVTRNRNHRLEVVKSDLKL